MVYTTLINQASCWYYTFFFFLLWRFSTICKILSTSKLPLKPTVRHIQWWCWECDLNITRSQRDEWCRLRGCRVQSQTCLQVVHCSSWSLCQNLFRSYPGQVAGLGKLNPNAWWCCRKKRQLRSKSQQYSSWKQCPKSDWVARFAAKEQVKLPTWFFCETRRCDLVQAKSGATTRSPLQPILEKDPARAWRHLHLPCGWSISMHAILFVQRHPDLERTTSFPPTCSSAADLWWQHRPIEKQSRHPAAATKCRANHRARQPHP